MYVLVHLCNCNLKPNLTRSNVNNAIWLGLPGVKGMCAFTTEQLGPQIQA